MHNDRDTQEILAKLERLEKSGAKYLPGTESGDTAELARREAEEKQAGARREAVQVRLALSADDVCHALGVSKSALYESIARGEFPPARKLGRRSLWPRQVVESWLMSEHQLDGNHFSV